MSGSVKLWCFILLLPFFAAVGHDIYANYIADKVQEIRLEAFEIDPKSYQSSDLGYLFIKYTPNELSFARETVGEENWIKWVEPILRLYSFIVALVPALLYFIWLLVSRALDMGPFAGSAPNLGRTTGGATTYKKGQTQEFKFKRR